MTYKEQYLHPKWQRKRLEVLQRDDFKCTKCGDSENTLHVHHIEYKRNTDIWDYPDENLITLCETCHAEIHSPTIQKKVYIAGKIPCKARENIFSLRLKTEAQNVRDWDSLIKYGENMFGDKNEFEYTGPFYCKSQHSEVIESTDNHVKDDAGGHHVFFSEEYDGDSYEDIQRKRTFARCDQQIKDCDIFLAILEKGTEPYGTLVEIGIASKSNCQIIIITDSDDYWFAEHTGKVYKCDDVDTFISNHGLKILTSKI